MVRFLNTNSVVFMLLASLLANGLASAFHGEVFVHELGHNHQHTHSIAENQIGEHSHNEFSDGKNLKHSVHVCFSAVYQPTLFTMQPLLPIVKSKEILSEPITLQISKSIPDLPYHPPRNIFPS